MLGGHSGSVTPVPIPNTEVKPSNADDTASLRCGKVGRCQAFFCLYTVIIRKAARPKLEARLFLLTITGKYHYNSV